MRELAVPARRRVRRRLAIHHEVKPQLGLMPGLRPRGRHRLVLLLGGDQPPVPGRLPPGCHQVEGAPGLVSLGEPAPLELLRRQRHLSFGEPASRRQQFLGRRFERDLVTGELLPEPGAILDEMTELSFDGRIGLADDRLDPGSSHLGKGVKVGKVRYAFPAVEEAAGHVGQPCA